MIFARSQTLNKNIQIILQGVKPHIKGYTEILKKSKMSDRCPVLKHKIHQMQIHSLWIPRRARDQKMILMRLRKYLEGKFKHYKEMKMKLYAILR